MNLKSYLRGAGIGIIITALVLMVSGGSKSHAMTDDEVKARARQLGMTEGNEVLSEAYTVATAPEVTEAVPETASTAASTEASTEAAAEKASEVQPEAASEAAAEETKSAEEIIEESLKDQQTTSLTSDVTGEEKKKSELLADAAETEAESVSPVTESSSGFVSIHINSGSSSTVVAKALQSAGAVSSASDFDAFLCANGYDRNLSTGDFRIPAGASDEDIAMILMRRK